MGVVRVNHMAADRGRPRAAPAPAPTSARHRATDDKGNEMAKPS